MPLPHLVTVATLLLAPPSEGGEAPIDFATQVRPILEARCFECHGETKQKGRLRLDRRDSVFALAKGEPRVVPGKPDESALYRLVALPADDPDVMPADGDPLTLAEVAILRTWIEQGAPWPADRPDALAEVAPEPRPTDAGAGFDLHGLSQAEEEAVAAAIERVAQRGAVAMRVAADGPAVEVDFSLLGAAVSDEDVALLAGLEPRLVWLDLGRTAVTDAALPRVAAMAALRRLDLSNTRVGDEGLRSLATLSRLEVLNLYGTAVGDAGIASLAPLRRLRSLYLWQTSVSDAGVAALQAALPSLRIDRGLAALATATPLPAEDVRTPVNSACPVSGKPIDPAVLSELDGRLVGFCCTTCKGTFDQDPAPFRATLAAAAGSAASPLPMLLEGRIAALEGGEIDLATFAGKVVLVVVGASGSGYSSQYGELQRLHEELSPRGLAILVVPTDDFGRQEPGDAAVIADLLRRQYRAGFAVAAKTALRAPAGRPAFLERLFAAAGEPPWSFAKYLVGRDGAVAAFPPDARPAGARLRAAIEERLGG